MDFFPFSCHLFSDWLLFLDKFRYSIVSFALQKLLTLSVQCGSWNALGTCSHKMCDSNLFLGQVLSNYLYFLEIHFEWQPNGLRSHEIIRSRLLFSLKWRKSLSTNFYKSWYDCGLRTLKMHWRQSWNKTCHFLNFFDIVRLWGPFKNLFFWSEIDSILSSVIFFGMRWPLHSPPLQF